MTENATLYLNNVESFMDKIRGATVKCIDFNIDSNPTFNKDSLPFDFKYCYSLNIRSDKQDFTIQTTMADSGIETFWIVPLDYTANSTNVLEINQVLQSIEIKSGHDNFPFKLKLQFENISLTILSAEIYDNGDGTCDFKINDEMLLVFLNDNDATNFEKLTIDT